jgi:hypothetical protein
MITQHSRIDQMKDAMRAPWIAGNFGAIAKTIGAPDAEGFVDVVDVGGDHVRHGLERAVELLAFLPDLLVLRLLPGGEVFLLAADHTQRLEVLLERARCDQSKQLGLCAAGVFAGGAQHGDLDTMTAEHTDQKYDVRRFRDEHAIVLHHLVLVFRELPGRQDRMIGLRRPLVGAELAHEIPLPSLAILRIEDELGDLLAVVHEDVVNVGPGDTFAYALDAVALERSRQFLEQIDLGGFAQVVRLFLFEAALQALHLGIPPLNLGEMLGGSGRGAA